MQITVFCSDATHHVVPMLKRWCKTNRAKLVFSKSGCTGGDALFLISCTQIVGPVVRARYKKSLVIHESDLPDGRGWSPLAWQILGGRRDFTVSLIEAGDSVDSGPIWRKEKLRLEGHELSGEINDARDAVRERLMDWAVANFSSVEPKKQVGIPSYYPRREPKDSRLNPLRSLAEQFDLLRICDPRFPAFFELRGHRYEVTLRKVA